MLITIRIDNFALVDHIELEFGKGLNVLTGETGAGKSIILDAIDVVLGGKANQRMIRTGAKKAIVEATFYSSPLLEDWLEAQEIESFHDGTVICGRELSMSKDNFRSRCRINGVVINKTVINQLRDRLLEVTAQGETGQLLSVTTQRDLLDAYGGEKLGKQRQLVSQAFAKAQKALEALETRRQWEQQRLQRLDLIQHQIKELSAVHLESADELEQLEIESDRLTHVVELQQLSYQAYQLLYQSESDESQAVADILGKAQSIIGDMVNYDKELGSILEMVQEALNQVVEAGQQIYSYGSSLEADPERLEEIEERIRLLKRICRKYGSNLGEVIDYYHNLQKELTELTDNSQSIEELEQKYLASEQKMLDLCAKLTDLRTKASKNLETQLTQELKPLGMAKVQFQCRVTPINPNYWGADQVEFYFSPNPGEDLQPLAMTASGGEMSRFLLALKSCFSEAQRDDKTLIFDEIDTGVSGKVAQAIADKLHKLSHHHQVLCVTHQPLVAAMADHHFRVEKQLQQSSDGKDLRTIVQVRHLEEEIHRRDELAELTGGHSAEDAIAFADSLLEMAQTRKEQILLSPSN
ncbi:DNA repair protein RecN [Cyanobacterium aponinum UTEX 3222]|uniref:DNA repair protein RecN n=2 Tax=Cyanobacterium aponinum TaxID=379064 RepID=K9Z6F9_CYAAP|nr:DNA repair protein RecN [Cyanobacterium aponinum]AFZ54704.1 DNA replication and repair protein RecN [Cyanobacterium aponinum PCC 10605]MTF38348.1 DNA repair protein RecN [Cyanobacterium aponinum 0216]PHV61551.1 DNA repair protein RecN [Cyanobacterium aponinum IPPAS B-1201]WRL43312.1 DNA repair protein RecN [Cyanobacterium aponinum UTEX 3222]